MKYLRRMAAATATVGLAMAGVGLGSGAADATTYHISGWTTGTGCRDSGITVSYCLWYLPGQGTGGYGWEGDADSTYNIPSTATFTIQGSCPGGSGTSCGEGKPVKDDARSMSNATVICNVTVWQEPNNQGDADWLSPEQAGNLTSTLANHDESIDANNC